MRVTVVTAGTRGDVQPFVALGTGLAARGHEVTVATHARFAPEVGLYGLRHHALPGDPDGLFDHPELLRLRLSPRRPRAHARALHAAMAGLLSEISLDDVRAACAGADAVLFTMTAPFARDVADELGLPSLCVTYGPLRRTRAHAQPVLFGGARLGAPLNLATYPIAERLLRQPFTEPLRPTARRAAAAAAQRRSTSSAAPEGWPPFPIVHGYSEAISPRPPDWPAHLHVVGTWSLPPAPGARLPHDVDAFLAAGPPPVYVGFGSMRVADPAGLSRTVVDAVRAAGERAILGPGWAGLGRDETGDDVLAADLPHDLLFPHVKAVVHHGGAGTTATGLAAGRPTLIVPFVFDQLFWGHRVAAIGAGPKPIPRHALDVPKLRDALRFLAAPQTVAAAAAVGERMRVEDGVARGAGLVEGLLSGAR